MRGEDIAKIDTSEVAKAAEGVKKAVNTAETDLPTWPPVEPKKRGGQERS